MGGYHILQQINLASTLLLSNSSFGYLHSSAEIWVKKIKNGLFSSMTDHTKAHVPVVSWAFPRFCNSKWLVNLGDASPARICLPLYRFASFLFCVFSLTERGIVIVKYCPRIQHHSADQEKNVWVRSRFRKNIKAVYPNDVFSITLFQLLNILEEFVISKGLVYSRLDGGTKPADRTRLVHEFNVDPNIFLCLISTKAGGLGLNFTGANIVIIFDPNWNPSSDLQAQDRYLDLFRFRVWLAYN